MSSSNRASTLEGKTVVVVGGTSGIGFAVAKASLLALASNVIVASSKQSNVDSAVGRLDAIISDAQLPGKARGVVVNAKDSQSVKTLFAEIGELDHLVWTSGDSLNLKVGFPDVDADAQRGIFDVKFWGIAAAAQVAKIRSGGSITLTIGGSFIKPPRGWSLIVGTLGAVDALTRGLAVDLAPIRVNVVSPGLVKTELWDNSGVSAEAQEKMFAESSEKLLVKHVADADEIAEAYIFCMKCAYVTGQRIDVDGGFALAP